MPFAPYLSVRYEGWVPTTLWLALSAGYREICAAAALTEVATGLLALGTERCARQLS